MKIRVALFVSVFLLSPVAAGQSLMRPPQEQRPPMPAPQGQPLPVSYETDSKAELRAVSLLMVEPPRPRTYAVHDKVTILISEVSRQSSEQKLETKKDASLKATLRQFPDLQALLEAQLTNGDSSPIASVDVGSAGKFKGDGSFERSDRFTDKITATVIDVKPNGVLVLEARKTVGENKEVRTVVLSGECRREDVTENNTVLSSQLAELTIITRHDGDVKNAATKGVITRLFEAVFNF